MARYIIAPGAEQDIHAILAYSQAHLGEQARLRYEALIAQAILDVADDVEAPGSASREELAEGARTYHLHGSRNRVRSPPGQVKRPRHFLVYRKTRAGDVEIARVLHDSMDIDRHLPREYRRETGDQSESTSP